MCFIHRLFVKKKSYVCFILENKRSENWKSWSFKLKFLNLMYLTLKGRAHHWQTAEEEKDKTSDKPLNDDFQVFFFGSRQDSEVFHF